MTGSSSFNTKVIMWFKSVDLPSITNTNKHVITYVFQFFDALEIFKNCVFILKNKENSNVSQRMTL